MAIKVAIVGATGRMGKLAMEIVKGSDDLVLHCALDSKSELAETLGADVIFEATNLEVSKLVVQFAIENGMKVLVATSGWTQAALSRIDLVNASTVVVVPNFSIGSAIATKFAAEAAKHFNSIEIVESHHAGKIDSPSGTAIRTAELIAASRKESSLTQPIIPGLGQTARGEIVSGIPIHSLRLEGASAKQEVHLGGVDETLTISHTVTSIRSYSLGILESIRFTAQAQGLHVGLEKVLGI